MPRIRSLRPNVSRDAAVEEFSRGAFNSMRALVFGPLRSVADFYIPFQLFQVEISNRGKIDQRVFGLDAVSGSLDLYHFEQLPGPAEVVFLETRNCVPANPDEQRSQEMLLGKVRRLIFSTGFFRVRDLRLSAELIPGEIYVPYWVGFCGRGKEAMSNQIGRFEILSEITQSALGSVYKASDPDTGQTVVLKTLRLQPFGEQSAGLVQRVLEEVESAKPLNSPNIAQVYGAAEIDGQLCAWMEYVQGNSVGTMLARREGFSIWDLQDIARQTCQGLDHARVLTAVHWSLEPAKIMVRWERPVKGLDFGISTMGTFAFQIPGSTPEILYYTSPEQVRGEPLDSRSNLFSLGAILYEMVTERNTFAGNSTDELCSQITEATPPAPDQVNRKISPPLSKLIMRALAKVPDQRYQSGQEMIYDLENCNETHTGTHAKTAAKKSSQPGVSSSQSEMSSRTAPPPETSAARVRRAAAAAGWPGTGSVQETSRTNAYAEG